MKLFSNNIFFIVVFLLITFNGNSQNRSKAVFVSDNETYSLSGKIECFEDKSNKLTINKIISDSLIKFMRAESSEIHIDFSYSTFWYRFSIMNPTQKFQNLIFEVRNSTINKLQFFVVSNGRIYQTEETGDSHAFSTREFKNRNFIYEIKLQPDQHYVYYLKVQSEGDALNMPLKIHTYKEFNTNVDIENILYGIFYGIVIAILMITLSFYISFRTKANLFYFFFVFFIGFFNFYFDGFAYRLIWPDSPVFNFRMMSVLPFLSMVFMVLFTDEYLNLKTHLKRTHKYMRILALICFLFSLTGVFNIPFNVIAVPIYILAVVTLFSVIIPPFFLFKKEKIIPQLFLIAFAGLALAIFVISSNILTGFFSNYLRDYSLKIGISFQLIFLSIALSIKFKLMLDHSHKLVVDNLEEMNEMKNKLNIELEQKIKERTKELTLSNEKLEITLDKLNVSHFELGQKNEEIRAQYEEIQNQIEIVNEHKNKLEEHQKEITDSIVYAKHLQTAVFPSSKFFSDLCPEHFILFKPKDIVSGDFYWIKKKGNNIYIAVADCTGHGVPGAFLSIMGSNELNSAVDNYDLPHQILAEVNIQFNNLLNQQKDRIVHDGMNISLCCINFLEKKLYFSGALHSMLFIRNNVMTVYEGCRCPIGFSYLEQKADFRTDEITLQPDDRFFIFSDGFPDQRGGLENKKLKMAGFKNLILETSTIEIQKQGVLLQHKLNEWMGFNEQIDDILVIGVKI